MSVLQIDVQQGRQHVQQNEALLVCAYDSDEKFPANQLDGAISFDTFQTQADSLGKDEELIFY